MSYGWKVGPKSVRQIAAARLLEKEKRYTKPRPGRPSLQSTLFACAAYRGAIREAMAFRRGMRARRDPEGRAVVVDHIVVALAPEEDDPAYKRALCELVRLTPSELAYEALRLEFGSDLPSMRTLRSYMKFCRPVIDDWKSDPSGDSAYHWGPRAVRKYIDSKLPKKD